MKSRVVVYVEGPSDKAALCALLAPLIEHLRGKGVAINFFEAPSGDRKVSVLTKVPWKAASILINDPCSIVVAMPDLYPRNKGFKHETFDELVQGMNGIFVSALESKKAESNLNLKDRFKIFCLKHDLEALVLASEEGLKNQLGVRSLVVTWHVPVEEQDHGCPPKRIVEHLYQSHGKRYKDTVDAPLILGASDYQDVADKCPQCFRPFVEFLLGLAM